MTDNIDDNIERLITLQLSGEATPGETRELDAWLAKDPANASYLDKARRIFQLAEKHVSTGQKTSPIDVDQEWARFTARHAPRSPWAVPQSPAKVRDLRPTTVAWMRIAAALLLIAAAGFVINFFIGRSAETRFETLAEATTVNLPDGSIVTLNRNSSLSYARDFNSKLRRVVLQGEAFFEVTKDAHRPFVIATGEAMVKVVGTSFNVSAYDADPDVTVTVAEGRVVFTAVKSLQSIELGQGKKGVFSKERRKLSGDDNEDVNYTSWKTRHLEFNAAPLSLVIQTLNKTYGSNIRLSGPVSDACVVTVTFDQQTLEAVLAVLKDTLDLTFRVDGQRIEITSAGC